MEEPKFCGSLRIQCRHAGGLGACTLSRCAMILDGELAEQVGALKGRKKSKDACGETIENPYKAKMKEFCIACRHEVTGTFPWNTTYKTVVDLCDNCFHALREIAKNKEAHP